MANDIDPVIRTDAYVRHEMDVQRFAITTSNKFRAENALRVEREYSKVLSSARDITSKSQARALANKLAKDTSEVLKSEVASIGVEMEIFSQVESEWNKNVLTAVIGESAKMAAPNAIMTAAGKHKMSSGQSVNEFFGSVVNSNRKIAKRAVMKGWQEGKTNYQIAKQLIGDRKFGFKNGDLQAIRRNTDAAIRTSINAISDNARLQTFKANSDIVKKEMILATLDHRTSVTCQFYDKKVFKMGVGPRPPFHPNCRSLTIPLFEGEGAESITGMRPAVNAGPDYERGSNTTRTGRVRKPRRDSDVFKVSRTRASQTGYTEFMHRQRVAFQEDVLGVSKAKLFRDYGLEIDDMVKTTRNGYFQRPLTVKELQKKVNQGQIFDDAAARTVKETGDLTKTSSGAWTADNLETFLAYKKEAVKIAKTQGGNFQGSITINGRHIALVIKGNKISRYLNGKHIPVSKFRKALKDAGSDKPPVKPKPKAKPKKPAPPKVKTPAPKQPSKPTKTPPPDNLKTWTAADTRALAAWKKDILQKAKATGNSGTFSTVINGREIEFTLKNGKISRKLFGKPVPVSKFKAALRGQPAPTTKKLPDARGFSFVKDDHIEMLFKSLDDIGTPESKKMLKFIEDSRVKTIITHYSKAKNNKAKMPKGLPTSDYQLFHGSSKVTGFTSGDWNHIVVKATSYDDLKKISTANMKGSVDKVVERYNIGEVGGKAWSISDEAEVYDLASRVNKIFSTFLHEMSHQVHFQVHFKSGVSPKFNYKSKTNSLTKYATTNNFEWHAEHIAMWTVNRDALYRWRPDIAEYLDIVMDTALSKVKK